MKKLIIVMVLTLSSSICNAMPDTFECTVLTLSELPPEGTLLTDAPYQEEQIGSTFSVERKTGAIRGGYFLNNRLSKSVRVINEPDTDAYYVISESHGPFVMVSYLFIANHFKEPQKPFIYTHSGQYLYTGTCQ